MAIQDLQSFKLTELSGGIKIISEFIPRIESFCLGFRINIGARDEQRAQSGICHFIEHMLFKGTKKRSARKISEDVESIGGYLNAYTSKESTCYYGRGLANHIDKTFDVIADMVQNPLFKENHIKKESGVVLDELCDIEDNPEELIFDKFEELIFKGNSLAFPIIGNEKTITSFNHEILSNFHKAHYGQKSLLISAAGNVNHEHLVKLTEKYFQSVGKGKSKNRSLVDSVHNADRVVIKKEISQVHSIIGRKSYGYTNPKRLTLNMLSNILGEGSSSRLFQAVRERNGITYQINSFVNSYQDVSAFGVYFSTNEKNSDKAMAIIKKEFEKLRTDSVSNRELKRVKEYMKGSIILGLENTSSRMIRLADNMVNHGRFISVDEVVGRIDAITADMILEIAHEVLDDSTLTQMVLFSKNATLINA